MKSTLMALLAAQALLAADPGLHIPFEKYKLPNGLRVVLVRDTSVPLAAVHLAYDVGARSEGAGQAGYAHLLEHLITAGVELSASTHLDYTEFFTTLPSERLNAALWLEAGRMRSLAIDEQSLNSAREAIEKERAQSLAQPYRTAVSEQWPAQIFSAPANARAVMASADDIRSATVESAMKFFHAYYAPNNAVLTIAGDFETADAKKLITTYFGDIPSQPQPKRPDRKEPAREQGKAGVTKDPKAKGPALIVGWPAPPRHSPDWYSLNMIDAVLTAGEDARVRVAMAQGRESLLRADFNLGWSAASPLDAEDPTYYAGIMVYKPGFTAQQILDQYQSEIERIAREGVGRSELERLKDYLRFTRLGALQTGLSRARLLGIHELIDGDAGYADKDYASLLNVTAEQVAAAARKYLTPTRRDSLSIEGASK
jgi:predicted Zn-dependent peptidase